MALGLIFSIAKVKSGLLASDPMLHNGSLSSEYLRWIDTHGWNFDTMTQNGSNNFYEDGRGLHIGVKAAIKGIWEGYHALTPPNNATLFHANITVPYNSTEDGQFVNSGLRLYVQTSKGTINYIACLANVAPTGINWFVQLATGNTNQSTNLWTSATSNQPFSRDCTIITNGNNYLKVYLDNNLVYSNHHLNLQMPPPLIASLEVTTSSSSQLRYSQFNNYYSTADENLKVVNAPPHGLVKIVRILPSKLLAYGNINEHGVANLDIGRYNFPLNAQILVYDTKNSTIASTPPNTNLYGGDIYSVKIK